MSCHTRTGRARIPLRRVRALDHLDITRAHSIAIPTGNPVFRARMAEFQLPKRNLRGDIVGVRDTVQRALRGDVFS